MKSYAHSTVFNTLKQTVEDLQSNLTSAQYLHTLDFFIWKALSPIAAECPSFFYNYVAKCVAHQALHPNSKYTSEPSKDVLPLQLFNALSTEQHNPEAAFDFSRKLYLNRGLLFGLISKFLKETSEYKALQSAFHTVSNPAVLRSKLAEAEMRVGATTPANLYPAVKQVEYWDDKARHWKEMIVQKYTRMALMSAKRTYVDFNHYVPLDDVSQIHLLVTSKAIDRCDPRMGVLTTFINRWLKSARAQVAEEAKGQADDSLEAMAESLGDSMSLGAVLPDTTSEEIQEIAYKAQLADPEGVVRTMMGIPQYVSAKHRDTLLTFALE
jgi:hypothetical protein